MPVFQRNDPLSAASEAVGSYYTAKRQREVENAAAAHQAAREGRQDMESDRSFGIQNADLGIRKSGEARAEKLFGGELTKQADDHTTSVDAHNKSILDQRITESTEKYNAAVRPLELKMKTLELQFKRGEITSQAASLQHQQIQNQIDTFTAHHQAETQALEMAKGQASIRSSNASADASEASAYRTMHPVSAASTNAANYDSTLAGLSPKAQAALNGLDQSKSPLQNLLLIQANPHLSPQEKASVRSIIEGSNSSDLSPIVKTPKGTDPNARTNALVSSSLERNPKFKALPANAQAGFLEGVSRHGYAAAIGAYKRAATDPAFAKANNFDPNETQGVLDALGVQMPQQGGGFSIGGWHPFGN